MSPWQINQLGKAALRGAVFAYPTDTIWGFGCQPMIASSVYRIFDIKQRSSEKGLILLASNLDHLKPYIKKNLNHKEIHQLQTITRQPTTWLVEADEDCPYWLRGQFATIAVRLTNHPFVQRFCDAIKSPLVSTSANRAGGSTIRNSLQARRHFSNELDFIVEGFNTGKNQASEIKLLANDRIIRPQNL